MKRYVYFVRAVTGGPIKIGVTDNVDKRVYALQSANPARLEVLGVIHGCGPVAERVLHQFFKDDRRRGEWFAATPELLEFIRKHTQPWHWHQAKCVARTDAENEIDWEAMCRCRNERRMIWGSNPVNPGTWHRM